MERIICPLCGATAEHRLVERWRRYKLLECCSCSLQFWYPLERSSREYYEQSLSYLFLEMGDTLGWEHRMFFEDRPGLSQGRRKLLDVGCGSGAFIDRARKMGYEVWGIDINRNLINIAREKFGLANVFALSLEEFASHTDQRFGVVTLFEVIEHVVSPLDFMRLVSNLCEVGGYIVLSTPNRDRDIGFFEGDYPPNHLTRWNMSSIRFMMEMLGFKIIKILPKPLSHDDVANFLSERLRFGLIKKTYHSLREAGAERKEIVARVGRLLRLRRLLLFSAGRVIATLLRPLGLRGMNIYCLAQKP